MFSASFINLPTKNVFSASFINLPTKIVLSASFANLSTENVGCASCNNLPYLLPHILTKYKELYIVYLYSKPVLLMSLICPQCTVLPGNLSYFLTF